MKKTNFVVVGSVAAHCYFPDFRGSTGPTDIDIISPSKNLENGDVHWHPGLQCLLDSLPPESVAGPDILYTLKVSHAAWDIHWEKTMWDIAFFQSKGCQLNGSLFDQLYTVWEEVHGKKRINLEATPKDFFSRIIKRQYVHDSIHASVAYYDQPLFKSIWRDGSNVAVDKLKFEALSLADRKRLAREEVYSIALERELIPKGYHGSPRAAYSRAIKALITTMSKGWFNLFLLQNWLDLQHPDVDYLARHKQNSDKLVLMETM